MAVVKSSRLWRCVAGTGLALWLCAAAGGFAQSLSPAVRKAEPGAVLPGVSGYYSFSPLPDAPHTSPSLVWVAGGSFAMGNSYSNLYPSEGWAQELPVHAVPVSDFAMGRFEITNEEMARMLQWALTNGLVELGPTYAVFTNGAGVVTNVVTNLYGTVRNTEGTKQELVDLDATYCQIAYTNGAFAVATGKTNFPALFVTWYGAQAFGNYLSDREGLDRAVDFGPSNWSVNVHSPGYRLPTEAEWEKACRGGNPGTHFPWPDDSGQGTNLYLYSTDPAKANYWDGRYGPLSNHPGHPWFSEPIRTTPVGYYNGLQVVTNLTTNFMVHPGTRGADFGQTNDMVNGYGLYDMAGNVYEWCGDYLSTNWYSNAAATQSDPTGPAVGASFHEQRIFRGGGFTYYSILTGADPSVLRCSFRSGEDPARAFSYIGFRVTRRVAGVGEVAPATPGLALNYWGVSGRVYTVKSATNLLSGTVWQYQTEVTNRTTGASQIPVGAAGNAGYLRMTSRPTP